MHVPLWTTLELANSGVQDLSEEQTSYSPFLVAVKEDAEN